MKTIWHYSLVSRPGCQAVSIPAGGKVLCAANREGRPTIYVEVESDARRQLRTFWTLGTGNPMPDTDVPLTYIGTVQQPPYWWHIYEEA